MSTQQGWSYQTALDNLNNEKRGSTALPRMDVASLIAAKRKNLKRPNGKSSEDDSDIESKSNDSKNSDEEESQSSDSESDGGDSESEEESSESDDEDDQVDDADREMEEDVIKEEMWRGMLHNDEGHTFNYVISSLIKVIGTIDKKKAHDICVQTHGQGQAVVAEGGYKQQAMKYCVGMQRAGLTASIAPDGKFEGGDPSPEAG